MTHAGDLPECHNDSVSKYVASGSISEAGSPSRVVQEESGKVWFRNGLLIVLMGIELIWVSFLLVLADAVQQGNGCSSQLNPRVLGTLSLEFILPSYGVH